MARRAGCPAGTRRILLQTLLTLLRTDSATTTGHLQMLAVDRVTSRGKNSIRLCCTCPSHCRSSQGVYSQEPGGREGTEPGMPVRKLGILTGISTTRLKHLLLLQKEKEQSSMDYSSGNRESRLEMDAWGRAAVWMEALSEVRGPGIQ